MQKIDRLRYASLTVLAVLTVLFYFILSQKLVGDVSNVDKIAHIIGGMLLACLTDVVLARLAKLEPYEIGSLCLMAVLALGCLWELWEWVTHGAPLGFMFNHPDHKRDDFLEITLDLSADLLGWYMYYYALIRER